MFGSLIDKNLLDMRNNKEGITKVICIFILETSYIWISGKCLLLFFVVVFLFLSQNECSLLGIILKNKNGL